MPSGRPSTTTTSGRWRPSEGCTSTQPLPEKPSWKLSPEPSPISDLACTSARRLVVTEPDQAIADDGSANVGASLTSSRSGSPSETSATVPVPCSATLKSPPASIPAVPPLTRVMSQSMPRSNARMFAPLTVSASLVSRTTWTSIAWLARNSSPEPVASISRSDSPVAAFLSSLPRPPPLCSKCTSPW